MPNVYQPGLIQIRPQYQSAEVDELSTPENVLWFQGSTLASFPLTAIQLAVIAAAFDGAWATLWKQNGSSTHHYEGSITTDWSVSTGLQLTTVGTLTPTAGLQSGQMPAQVSHLTSLIAGGMPKYRGGHPRVYLPMQGTGNQNDTYTWLASLTATMTTQWNNLATAMAGVPTGDGGSFAQVVYRNRNKPASAAVYTVTHYTPQQRIATQRRRLRKAPHH